MTIRPSTRGSRLMAPTLLVAALALSACGDDEDAQERYCEAGSSLSDSLAALTSTDLIAEGTSGLQDALDTVVADVGELRDAATGAVEDDVEALGDSLDALGDVLGDLGGDAGASEVTAALGDVQSSAQAVLDTLADC